MTGLGLQGWVAVVAVGVALTGAAAEEERAWDVGGDFRVRYEGNSAGDDTPERHRGVLRFRLGGSYRVNELFTIGARLVTGDPGDPRTADVTIGDFLDDFELSLDRAYVEMRRDATFATAGKFANPFSTTELVWDGDVNPTGAAGSVELGSFAGGLTSRFKAIYMLVDEQSIASDSTMWGAQLALAKTGNESFGVQVAAAYWDYRIAGLEHANDSGDLRGNYLTADGSSYLSDFDLADFAVTLDLPGPTAGYPLKVVADVVKNLGAAVDEDQGFGIDVYLGSAWVEDRFELRYGYAQCETDAVLGAFSHDNIPLATNYRNHAFRVSYGLLEDTNLSFTWYYFCRLHADQRYPEEIPGEYSSRIRLDLMLRF